MPPCSDKIMRNNDLTSFPPHKLFWFLQFYRIRRAFSTTYVKSMVWINQTTKLLSIALCLSMCFFLFIDFNAFFMVRVYIFVWVDFFSLSSTSTTNMTLLCVRLVAIDIFFFFIINICAKLFCPYSKLCFR